MQEIERIARQGRNFVVAKPSAELRAALGLRLQVEDFDPLGVIPPAPPEFTRRFQANAAALAENAHMRQLEEGEKAAEERLRENEEDAELIAQAVAVAHETGEFRGRAWERLSDKLCGYAWKTLQSKIRSGEIADLVAKYTTWYLLHYGDAETLRVDADARMELATEILLRAVPDFQRNALMGRRWVAEGGARLTTYFLGTCAFHFRRAYEHWSKERRGKLNELATTHDVLLVWADRQISATAQQLAGHDPRLESALHLLQRQDEITQVIYQLVARGLTHAEIAEQVGLSPDAVESRVRRFRSLVKREAVAA